MILASLAIKKSLIVPIPSSINYMWGFGSLLGVSLGVQVVSGVLLAFNYEASAVVSFDSIVHICHDVWGGWLFRSIHANGASLFFVLMYTHIGRGMYFGGHKNNVTWVSGVSVLVLAMATAFLGYVLPWGQMSLWGATVITNLVSAIPYVGMDLVIWLWGGFSVGSPTLVRFFSLHFILPFVISGVVVVHVLSLHVRGSSNPLGIAEQVDKVSFHPYFTLNDLVGLVCIVAVFAVVVLLCPDLFIDPDNFVVANPLVTPPHIQPEWYFLFAYAILRSVPSKLGGVVALVLSVVVLYLGILNSPSSARFSAIQKSLIITFFCLFTILTWVGAMPATYPLVEFGKLLSVMYFTFVIAWVLI